MAIAERTAETTWEGTLASGHGSVSGNSGALDALEVTWAARTQAPDGKTSPEELAAAAHSSSFAMALSLRLGENKVRAERLGVGATVTLDERDGVPTIVSSELQVKVQAPELDDARLQEIVQEAAALCPVSRLFTGAEISVHAELA
jgi:osmotically inducible protein OsmC